MATYPQTGSILTREPGGFNRTGTSLSTNIVIKVGPNTVGAIKQLQIVEQREIGMISEVGTDGHIDSVPTRSTDISGNVNRVRFDRLRLSESFGRGFIHLHAMRYPFNIEIIDNFNGDGNNAIITTLVNVWFSNFQYSYTADNFIIEDSAQWKAEAIRSTLSNGNAATGGERGLPLAIDPIEREADIGKRRGSLDAPGILRSFLAY